MTDMLYPYEQTARHFTRLIGASMVSPFGAIRTDDETIYCISRAAATLFGCDPIELIGRSVHDLTGSDRHAELVSAHKAEGCPGRPMRGVTGVNLATSEPFDCRVMLSESVKIEGHECIVFTIVATGDASVR